MPSDPAEKYPLASESFARPGVPGGTVTEHSWTSQIFPGTVRKYWVYTPAQYQPDKPACVMVFQDGWSLVEPGKRSYTPVVFDNLIAQGEMPVTVGVFVNPGVSAEGKPARINRSFEYDSLSDRYARLLLEEILPEVGRTLNLSGDPNDRAICGGSSGGIAAFTVAWQRPDAFRRVFAFIGSFTNLRGGDIYPALVRKTEVKPLRVHLQSGSKDMNTFGGNWHLANQHMLDSLEYMGYDVKAVFGDEGHNGIQFEAILPAALRWLWRGHPAPIDFPRPPATREWAMGLVDPMQSWHAAAGECTAVSALAADAGGTVFYADDSGGGRIHRVSGDGESVVFREGAGVIDSMAFAPGGELYTRCPEEGCLRVYTPAGEIEKTIALPEGPGGLAIGQDGGIYFALTSRGEIWRLDASGGARSLVHRGELLPLAMHVVRGASLLTVTDAGSNRAWSFLIEEDGSLSGGEPFYRLETLDAPQVGSAGSLAADKDGLLYIATDAGIQVADREGRIGLIINHPMAGSVVDMAFGGPDFQTLYVVAGGRLFSRPTTLRNASNR